MSWSNVDPEDVPSSETVRGVPRRHWGCHLHTFDWSVLTNGQAKWEAVAEFMDAHEEEATPHLLLLGREGAGKTHIAAGLFRWAVYVSDLSRAAFVHVPSFSHEVKRSFGDRDVADPFERVEGRDLVVLDDPFGREPSEWELGQVIPRLIDSAYRSGSSLVVTANHERREIANFLHPHEMSRLTEGATEIRFFQDDDYRLRGSR